MNAQLQPKTCTNFHGGNLFFITLRFGVNMIWIERYCVKNKSFIVHKKTIFTYVFIPSESKILILKVIFKKFCIFFCLSIMKSKLK